MYIYIGIYIYVCIYVELCIQVFGRLYIYTAIPVYEISQTELIWFTKATLSGLQSTLAKLNLTIWVTNPITKFQNLVYEIFISLTRFWKPIRNSKIWFTKYLFR